MGIHPFGIKAGDGDMYRLGALSVGYVGNHMAGIVRVLGIYSRINLLIQ